MDLVVKSRTTAKAFSWQANIPDCVIISITDVDSNPNVFAKNKHIKGVLRLQFDDVEVTEPNAITEKDAKEILSFVDQFLNKVDLIVVHCEAGVSRSAGVCAALMQIINGDDSAIFDSSYYCPNMTCYRTVLTTYYGKPFDEEVVQEKEQKNIQAWRKANGLD